MIVIIETLIGDSFLLPPTESVHTLYPAIQGVLVPFGVHAQLHCTHDVTGLFTEGAQYVTVHGSTRGVSWNRRKKTWITHFICNISHNVLYRFVCQRIRMYSVLDMYV